MNILKILTTHYPTVFAGGRLPLATGQLKNNLLTRAWSIHRAFASMTTRRGTFQALNRGIYFAASLLCFDMPLRLISASPVIFLTLASALALPAVSHGRESVDLTGTWRVCLGGPEPQFPATACPAFGADHTIELPGTTETRGLGPENREAEIGRLTRIRKFVGPVWYEREVDIPASFEGRRVSLNLERTKYAQVWLDGRLVTEHSLYTVPMHAPVAWNLTRGTHRLTIMIDNRLERLPVNAPAHQYSDDTQTNWNGILGKMELVATDSLAIEDIQAYPRLADSSLLVKVHLAIPVGATLSGKLTLSAASFNHAGPVRLPEPLVISLDPAAVKDGTLQVIYSLGKDALTWDEFSPALYRLTAEIDSSLGQDRRTLTTGLRDFSVKGTQFSINGRITFLRGKHDACVFPLTGHPSMDVDGWLAYLRTCQDYGINQIRCHTWVPPEAAFEAADILGIYLQPELPFWGNFTVQVRDGLMKEAEAILREYGNHPSFVMMTLANEAYGDRSIMNEMVVKLRSLDSRHLYSDGSNNVFPEPREQYTNDFWTTAKVISPSNGDHAFPVRGSFCVLDGAEGHTQWNGFDTRADLSKAIEGISRPVIGHETGQWTVYPDFRQISKYTGVVRARNLERFQLLLDRHGMGDQSEDFATASGLLAARLYREENELFLRTPNIAGFQLLDLQDFPGQGTALVGVLDAFMDSKGLMSPEEWRRSCSSIVPLACLDRYTWTSGQTFMADLKLAHYGSEDLREARAAWMLVRSDGQVLVRGSFPAANYARGGLRVVGAVQISLPDTAAAVRCDLKVEVVSGSQRYENDWPIWLYPKKHDVIVPRNVSIVRHYDQAARRLLESGANVVLIPDTTNWADTVSGAYATDYWNWPMFGNTPGTMGLLCHPDHPALKEFPTLRHSERQWTAIASAATPVVLAEFPESFRPLVQVIDNYERNQKLGLIFEARVGTGSLLVCACNLLALQDRPEARQLFESLVDYAASPAFQPESSISEEQLSRVLRPSLAFQRDATASSVWHPDYGPAPEAARCVDGDINTRWIAGENDKAPAISVDLGGSHLVDGVELWWETDAEGYRYVVEGQTTGGKWIMLCDERDNTRTEGRHFLACKAQEITAIRVASITAPKGQKVALRELRVLGD
jgi:hypothetical protein